MNLLCLTGLYSNNHKNVADNPSVVQYDGISDVAGYWTRIRKLVVYDIVFLEP